MEFARVSELIFLLKKKGKNQYDPKGYRPIALLVCEGKEFARLVAERLKMFQKETPLSKKQYGFSAGRDTKMALGRMLDYVLEKWDAQSSGGQKLCGMVSLDIAKAYDTVFRCGLIYKLHKRGMGGRILAWLCDYFQERKHYSKIENYIGEEFENWYGLPQGCPLSTYL